MQLAVTVSVGQDSKMALYMTYFVARMVSYIVQPTMPLRWHLGRIIATFLGVLNPPVPSCILISNSSFKYLEH